MLWDILIWNSLYKDSNSFTSLIANIDELVIISTYLPVNAKIIAIMQIVIDFPSPVDI